MLGQMHVRWNENVTLDEGKFSIGGVERTKLEAEAGRSGPNSEENPSHQDGNSTSLVHQMEV
jgi:hypothetical protein